MHVPELLLRDVANPSSKLGSTSQQILADHAEPKGSKRMTPTNLWPELPLAEWKDTYDTLRMWTQFVVHALYYRRIEKNGEKFLYLDSY